MEMKLRVIQYVATKRLEIRDIGLKAVLVYRYQ